MPGSQPHPKHLPPPRSDDGVRPGGENPPSFLRGLQQHLEARGELLAIESRDAVRHTVRKTLLGTACAGAAFFAYGLILCAAVSLSGPWLESRFPDHFDKIGWQCAALLIGLLHIIVAFIFLALLRRKPAEPLFEASRHEFQKDHQWIQDQQTRNESGS